MKRCLLALVAFLFTCALMTAPVPEPFVKDWDRPVDPDKDCKIRRDRGTLTIEMPGSDHDYDFRRKRLNAPRLMRDLDGDFEIEVRVRIDCRPSIESSVKGQPSYVSAGFLIVLPDNACCIRMQYRVEGQGAGADGCLADIEQGAERGGLIGVGPLKGHPRWSFKGKPKYVYLRLSRQDIKLSGYISADHENWLSFGGGLKPYLPSKLKIGLAAGTTSIDPSKVVFDQIQISRGRNRKPLDFVSGWGNPIDPDKDCKIQRNKDAITIEMPGAEHDYDPVRERFNAPRILSDLGGWFDLQVRVRIDYRPSAQSTVKGQPSFVSAGFLLIYPDKDYSICARPECAVAQPGSILAVPRTEPGLVGLPRKDPAPKGKETESYAVMKTWYGERNRKSKTLEWDHSRPRLFNNTMWSRRWPKWPLPEKVDYVYLRLDHREGWSNFYISPDGEKWTRLEGLLSLPKGGKIGLAAYSTSTEPSKVIFDQLKLARDKKKDK